MPACSSRDLVHASRRKVCGGCGGVSVSLWRTGGPGIRSDRPSHTPDNAYRTFLLLVAVFVVVTMMLGVVVPIVDVIHVVIVLNRLVAAGRSVDVFVIGLIVLLVICGSRHLEPLASLPDRARVSTCRRAWWWTAAVLLTG